jgi:hypothetical protein
MLRGDARVTFQILVVPVVEEFRIYSDPMSEDVVRVKRIPSSDSQSRVPWDGKPVNPIVAWIAILSPFWLWGLIVAIIDRNVSTFLLALALTAFAAVSFMLAAILQHLTWQLVLIVIGYLAAGVSRLYLRMQAIIVPDTGNRGFDSNPKK